MLDHLYQGLCPDAVNGPDSRDPDCIICQLLDRPEAPLTHHRAQLASLNKPPMPDLNLDELERLEQAATPGPWVCDSDTDFIGGPNYGICQFFDKYEDDFNDCEVNVPFIVAARNALPALLARARQADAMEAVIRAAVRSGNPLEALAELHDFAERELNHA